MNSLVGWAYLAFRSLAQLLCRSIHLAEGFMDLDSHNWVINYCFKIYVFGLFLLGNSCQNLEASSLPRFINLNFSRRLMSHWTTPHSFGSNKSDLSWRKNHHVFPKGCFIQVNDSNMHIFFNNTLTNVGKGPTIFAGLLHFTQFQLYETRKVSQSLI